MNKLHTKIGTQICILILLLSYLFPELSAQPNSAGKQSLLNKDGQVELVKTKLSLVSLFPVKGSSMIASFGIDEARKEIPVKVANFRMMSPLNYQGPLTLKLLEQAGGEPVAEITLNPSWKETIAVIYPNRSKTGFKYTCLIFNGAVENFPAGARMVFNLTNFPIKGEWGQLPFKIGDKNNQTFNIKSLNTKLLTALDPSAPTDQSQPILMHYRKDDKWHAFVESRWFHEPNKRHYSFLYTTSKRNAVLIKSIAERVSK